MCGEPVAQTDSDFRSREKASFSVLRMRSEAGSRGRRSSFVVAGEDGARTGGLLTKRDRHKFWDGFGESGKDVSANSLVYRGSSAAFCR